MCRHIVVVLPYCASCDAFEALIRNNSDKFKNLNDYEIINISGVDNPNRYKNPSDIKRAISACEADGKKTITLTVNRMLTGSTVPEWDTMLFLKDTSSPQEYDQAVFRLQNQYIKPFVDENGETINYQTPQKKDGTLDPEAGLIDTISLITDLETQRQKLAPYNRMLLESGEYWRRAEGRFNVNTRIDTTLMNNLRVMRRRLITRIKSRANSVQISTENIVSIVHGLLSRSILIKYLEERKDSNGESVFPKDFYEQFSFDNTVCKQYTDVLGNKESTYSLFSVLESKFNGDMLPLIDNEREIITEGDLQELKSFLIGASDLESQQMTLWPL